MAPPLFGLETEYALSAPVEPGDYRAWYLGRMLEIARNKLVSLPDQSPSGMFLENGARIYVDCGQHLEYATAECSNPWDAVRQLEAGHLVVQRLIEETQRFYPTLLPVRCFRVNVDYSGTGTTWGCHESYLYTNSTRALSEQLIPHLVTRTIYTGAGGFDPAAGGLTFTLTPRASYIQRVVSGDSTSDRGIFHTRNESLAKAGYNRLHVLCGEGACSQTASFLKVGVTSLIVAMIDAGVEPGSAVQLAAPLSALSAVARDIRCRERLRVRGTRTMTAIQIQRHYLRMAEEHVNEAFMPAWARQVCALWRNVLDRLEDAPRGVDRILDWAIKLALYTDQLERRGMDWKLLHQCTDLLERLRRAYDGCRAARAETEKLPRFTLELATSSETPIPVEAAEIAQLLQAHGLDWDALRRILHLRAEFCEIDMRFSELGNHSIFAQLDAAGILNHSVAGLDGFGQAASEAPAGGRASLRSEHIRRLARSRTGHWRCNWDSICNLDDQTSIDLSDPFAGPVEQARLFA